MGNSDVSTYVGLPVDESTRVLFIVLGYVVCITGVVGNLLLLMTLVKHRNTQHLQAIYIINLSLSDLIIEGYFVPFWILDLTLGYHPLWGSRDIHCSFNGWLSCTCYTVSVLLLLLISANRYVCICHPALFHRLFGPRLNKVQCAAVWFISAVLTLPPAFGVGPYAYDVQTHLCAYDRSSLLTYMNVYAAVFIPLPTILVGAFNMAIYIRWKKSGRRVSQWKLEPTSAVGVSQANTKKKGLFARKGSTDRSTKATSRMSDAFVSRFRRPETDAGLGSSTAGRRLHAKVDGEQVSDSTSGAPTVIVQRRQSVARFVLKDPGYPSDGVRRKGGEEGADNEFSGTAAAAPAEGSCAVYPFHNSQSRNDLLEAVERKEPFPDNDTDTDISEIHVSTANRNMDREANVFGWKNELSGWASYGERRACERARSSWAQTETLLDGQTENMIGCVSGGGNIHDNDMTHEVGSNISAANATNEREIAIRKAQPPTIQYELCSINSAAHPSSSTRLNAIQHFPDLASESQAKGQVKVTFANTLATTFTSPVSQTMPTKIKRVRARDIVLVRSLLAIWICLLVLNTPFLVATYVSVYTGGSAELFLTMNWLVFLNNAINWLLYGILNKSFRREVMRNWVNVCRCFGKKVSGQPVQ